MKQIENFDGYFVDEQGNVYSNKSGTIKKLKPFTDRNGYKEIRLRNNHKQYKCCLIHRLVANAFIPNPNNLPEVNHKDKNRANNCAENLEWCTRKDNLIDSYSTMSPVRNFNSCKLFYDGIFVERFQSISAAARYGAEKYNASFHGLSKNLVSGKVTIIPNSNNRIPVKTCRIPVNKSKRALYQGDICIGIFKNLVETGRFAAKKFGVNENAFTRDKFNKQLNLQIIDVDD